MSYSYYNGKYAPTEEIAVPLTDRALYFGDGIYDAAIGRGGRIFLLSEHIDRLLGNAPKLSIPLSLTRAELESILFETVNRSGLECYFVYFQLTRNGGKRSHIANNDFGSNLLVTVSSMPPPKARQSLKLVTYEDKRFEYCNIKTLNLIPSVLAASYADECGCDEAIFHRGKTVTECAHSNISVIKDNTLITHPADNHILPGITRKHLISAAKKLGISVIERPFTLDELFDCDEAVVTSTSKLISGVSFINGKAVGGHDNKSLKLLAEELISEYNDEMSL